MNFPLLLDGSRFSDQGTVSGSSGGTALTNSGVAHTKNGTYTQLVASSPFDAHGFLVQLSVNSAGTNQSYLVDIAIGASSAEVVIVPNLLFDTGLSASYPHGVIWIPIPIPAGTRISARQQNNTTTGTLRVSVILLGGGLFGVPFAGRCSDIGTDTSASNGTVYDPGGSGNTKGGYTQLTASVPHDVKALILAAGSNRNSGPANAKWLVDVAIGGGGSEQVVVPNLQFASTTANSILPAFVGPIPVNIPAGSRLSVNAQCSVTDATDRKFGIAAYGIG